MVHWYPKYMPVGARRARAAVEMHELRERGVTVQPVEVRDRNIARSFWGRRWCEHLESFSDYADRLPRGRAYVHDGSVCHLVVEPGRVEAMVAARDLYRVVVRIRRLDRPAWNAIRTACAGQIGSVLELLQGRLSDRVVNVVAHRDTGLFPPPGEIELACDCPDRAAMCKHAMAVLYGVGSRLDDSPELIFRLRGVDEAELIAADGVLPGATASGDALPEGHLGDVIAIDLDPAGSAPVPNARKPAAAGTDPTGTTRAPGAGSSKPATGTDPAGATRAPGAGSSKPATDTEPAGATRALAADPSKPAAAGTDPTGATRAPGAGSSKPATGTEPAGAPRALSADSSKSATGTDLDAAPPVLVSDSSTPAASASAAPKKAPRHRPARTDRAPALPRREDERAAAPRFRLTGALIAGLRERCGFSVAEFAELLRVSGTTVRRWEAAPGPIDLRGRSREALTVLRLEIEKEPE